MPNIIKGMIQLDSKWEQGQPLLPSILISKYSGDFQTSGVEFNRLTGGTELLWFINKYLGGLYDEFRTLSMLAEENSGVTYTTPIYSYYGYIENSRIDFYFSLEKSGAEGITNMHIKWYNKNGTTVMGTSSFRITQGAKGFYNLNDGKVRVYMCISDNVYTREDGFILYIYTNPSNPEKNFSMYSSNLTEYSRTILTYLFYYPAKEDTPEGDIGIPEGATNENTDIDVPDLPQQTILNGFHNMYNPDIFDIRGVSKSLWSLDFTTNFLKVFSNPIDSIVSLTLSPIQPPLDETKSAIYVGNLPMVYTDGGETIPVTSRTLSTQYGQYSFGTIMLFEEYKNYLDYDSKAELYIPYISVVQLNIDDVMNSTLELVYNVDFFTGDFIAFLKCGKLFGTTNSVLYHWKGNLLTHIPITSNNYAQTIMTGLSTVFSLPQGNIGGAITNTLQSLKPSIEKGTVTSGGVGSLDNFEAYIILSKPVENKPSNYNILKGTPSNKNVDLVQGLGYVECEEIHVNNIYALEEEKKELENLLTQGVIF